MPISRSWLVLLWLPAVVLLCLVGAGFAQAPPAPLQDLAAWRQGWLEYERELTAWCRSAYSTTMPQCLQAEMAKHGVSPAFFDALRQAPAAGQHPGAQAAGETERPVPRTIVIAPANPPTTYAIVDMGGRHLTADVPALGSPALALSDPIQGTVEVTVLGIDGQTNQVTVWTQMGQTLLLTLAPETLPGLQVGQHFTLSFARR